MWLDETRAWTALRLQMSSHAAEGVCTGSLRPPLSCVRLLPSFAGPAGCGTSPHANGSNSFGQQTKLNQVRLSMVLLFTDVGRVAHTAKRGGLDSEALGLCQALSLARLCRIPSAAPSAFW
eukprot:4515356-Amphidinium_carterae.1